MLFVGKRSKTWYFQKAVGDQTKRIQIGRFPTISAQAARQTALGFALEMGKGAGKVDQIGAPSRSIKSGNVSTALQYESLTLSWGISIKVKDESQVETLILLKKSSKTQRLTWPLNHRLCPP